MKKIILTVALAVSFGSFSQTFYQKYNDSLHAELELPLTEYEQVGPRCDTNKCGRWLTYYSNGEVAMVETFDDRGQLTGERVTFRTDGTIKHYTEWLHGYKVGKEIYFDETGYPIRVIDHEKYTGSVCDGQELDDMLREIEQDKKRRKVKNEKAQ